MPQFRYEVKKSPGKLTEGVLEAESQRAALARLRDMGYFPIRIEEYLGEEKKDTLKRSLTRVKLKDRNIFFRQLANLTESGMPIIRALTTLIEQTQNVKLTETIVQLREDVQKGSSFAEAMERQPKIFPTMYCNLVRAGEKGGMLEEVLWRIVDFGEQEEELRGKAISAMIYPIFLLVVGSIAIFILISFVFPKFVTIFEDFNATLPWPTQVVMGLCNFMGNFWWAVLIGLAVLAGVLVSYFRTEEGSKKLDIGLLRSPIVGGVVQRYEMAKFARTFGTLIDNGVPVLIALRITSDTLTSKPIAEEVDTIHARVTEGDSISDSLVHSKYFPPMVVNMIAVGEEGGRLGTVAKRVADAYDTEVDRAVKAMAALFEPILIVTMGIIIGFLVIAMLLPMLTLSAHVG